MVIGINFVYIFSVHSETTYIASVKGAPETLKPMFNPGSVPDKYDQTYMELSRRGTRIFFVILFNFT